VFSCCSESLQRGDSIDLLYIHAHISERAEFLSLLFQRNGRPANRMVHGLRDRFLFGRFFIRQRICE